MDLIVSPDGMSAYLVCTSGDALPSETLHQKVHELLQKNNIVKGVDEAAIQQVVDSIQESNPPFPQILVAQGKPPVHGSDSCITFHFMLNGYPPVLETANKAMASLSHSTVQKELVRSGAVLAAIIPSQPGEEGYTVNGTLLKARVPVEIHAKAGPGVQISPDGRTFVVAPNVVGYANCIGDTLLVENPIQVARDGMEARLTVYPNGNGRILLEEQDVKRWLEEAGVTHGVQDDAVKAAIAFAREPDGPFLEVVIARGNPPENGQHAQIQFLFKKQILAGSAVENSDRVNYWEREFLHGVQAGDLLARKIPATPGRDGFDVRGKILPCLPGKDVNLEAVGEVDLSGDGLECHALHDGIAMAIGQQKVGVYQIFKIPGDVDFKTGNLHMNGVLTIQGWVRAGFTVQATGDVVINGGVEPSLVESDANIVVNRGIIGGDHGQVHAGGTLEAHFLEHVTVQTGGDITVRDGMLGCHVTCNGKVTVTGEKGSIVGGNVLAAQGIEVNELGSRAGVPTVVDIGMDRECRSKMMAMERDCALYERNQQKVERAMLSLGRKGASGKLLPTEMQALTKIVHFRRDIELKRKTLSDFQARLDPTAASLKVNKVVHEGVTVFVLGKRMEIDQEISFPGEFVLDTERGRVDYRT